jgi:hypothetical protein
MFCVRLKAARATLTSSIAQAGNEGRQGTCGGVKRQKHQ